MKRRRNKNKEFLIFSICIVLVGIFQLIFILHLHRPGDGTNNDIKQEDEQLLARKKRDFLRQVDDIQQRTGSGGGSGGGNREHNNNVDNIQPKLNQYATKTDHDDDDDPDRDCIFRNSSLYRSVFVYPSPGELEWENDDGSILTKYGKARTSLYPWQEIDNRTKTLGEYHYRIRDARATQYTTEILVREILTNKQSCLRTTDPETASLFYIPYMASIEWHNGTQYPKSFETSPYGQAIMNAIDGEFTSWEQLFGWKSEYFKRRNGSDHILVMSEPCHGLFHPRSSPGNFVYIHAQRQLSPLIIISKDISRTFVQMYPQCSKKNILMPHPQSDGRWFNSRIDTMAKKLAIDAGMGSALDSPVSLSAEKEILLSSSASAAGGGSISKTIQTPNIPVAAAAGGGIIPNDIIFHQEEAEQQEMPRILAQYYKAGKHGSCHALRVSLEKVFDCNPIQTLLNKKKNEKILPKGYSFPHAFRHSTFCPAPGGDVPSAKRMYDAILAGCIPIILSSDFVWPFSNDLNLEDSSTLLNPYDFAIHLNTSQFIIPENNNDSLCSSLDHRQQTSNDNKIKTIQSYIETISSSEIQRLRAGGKMAAKVYSYYRYDTNLPDNPLQENILPNGGAAYALVNALSERVQGKFWPACAAELKQKKEVGKDPYYNDNVDQFKC